MFDIIFNLLILIWALIYTVAHWDDPSAAFWVGVNLTVATWCALDVVKYASKL